MSDVLVKMTEVERDLWLAFKAFIREEQRRTPAVVPAPGKPAVEPVRREEPLPGLVQAAVEQGYCGVAGKGRTVCLRDKGHVQRHRYRLMADIPKRHVPPPRSWVKEGHFEKVSGSRRYKIEVGYPCKVDGVRGMFKVIGIERHTETGKINVEVTNDRSGHSRVFPADKIIYKRPRKVSA